MKPPSRGCSSCSYQVDLSSSEYALQQVYQQPKSAIMHTQMGTTAWGRCCSGRTRLAESIIKLQIMRAPGPRSAGHTGASAWDHPRTPLSHHPTIAFFALRLRQRYSSRRTAEPHSCAWGNVAVREVLLRRDYCWLKTISKPLRFVVRHGRKFLNGGFRSPHYSVELLKAM